MDELVIMHVSEPIQQLNGDLLRVRLRQCLPFAELSLKVTEFEILHGYVYRVVILEPAVGGHEAMRILEKSQWAMLTILRFMRLAIQDGSSCTPRPKTKDPHERWKT